MFSALHPDSRNDAAQSARPFRANNGSRQQECAKTGTASEEYRSLAAAPEKPPATGLVY